MKLELKLKLKLYILLGCNVEGTADVGSTIAVEVEGQAEAAMAPGSWLVPRSPTQEEEEEEEEEEDK